MTDRLTSVPFQVLVVMLTALAAITIAIFIARAFREGTRARHPVRSAVLSGAAGGGALFAFLGVSSAFTPDGWHPRLLIGPLCVSIPFGLMIAGSVFYWLVSTQAAESAVIRHLRRSPPGGPRDSEETKDGS